VDFWPFFTKRHELDGNSRLQVLSILEPFLPNNKSVERDYSPVYSFWRSEKNGKTGTTSQSLFWNLYRRETEPNRKKISFLFGLFKYQTSAESKRWSLFYIPFGGSEKSGPEKPKK
jgi:hypothetical protein